MGIVTSSTVIIREARKPSEDSDHMGSEGGVVEKTTSFCNISVVNEIMHRIVMPYVNHSSEPAGLMSHDCAVPPLIKGIEHHIVSDGASTLIFRLIYIAT